jgi:hypothetical protein
MNDETRSDIPAAVRTLCDDPSRANVRALLLAILAIITEIAITDTEHLPDVDTSPLDDEPGLEQRLTDALLGIASTAALRESADWYASKISALDADVRQLRVEKRASDTNYRYMAGHIASFPEPMFQIAHYLFKLLYPDPEPRAQRRRGAPRAR